MPAPMPYEVDLADEGGALTWACTCPYAEDGSFCKHLVAAGLAAAQRRGLDRLPEPADGAAVPDAQLRSWLAGHQPADLVGLLMDAAGSHGQLRRELELHVAVPGTAARG